MFPRILLLCAIAAVPITGADGQEKTDAAWYTKKTQWHGFDQYHFQVADRNAYLVVPKEARKGMPWIWRARFPGFHAEMDIELAGKGYHIGYVDVAGLFGGPRAIEIGDQFYTQMTTTRGLNPKVVLEGVSRGGLLVYNWASKNADRVACIYCDTPVCDFRSWPQGAGKGIGSKAAWKQCLNAYGLTEQQAEQFKGLPIDHAQVIAEAKIPLLHIVSENDRVVPPEENTYLLRENLRKFGHDMEIISVAEGTEKSNGHHFTHPQPQRVVDFILAHTQP